MDNGILVEHYEFVEKCASRTIHIDVNTSKALSLYRDPYLLPRSYRVQLAIIFSVGFVAILLGFILLFYAVWYVVLAAFFFGLTMIFYARFEAGVGVLAAALRFPYVYEVAMEQGVLRIKAN